MSIRNWLARQFGSGLIAPRLVSRGTYTTASRRLRDEVRESAVSDGTAHRPGQADTSIAMQEQQIVHLHEQLSSNAATDMQMADAQLLPRFIEVRRDFAAAQRSYESKRNEPGIDGRPILIDISWTLYLLFVLGLIVGETAVNYHTFQVLFPDGDMISVLTAATIGFALLLVAHVIGEGVRQRRNLAWVVVLAALAVGGIASLAYLRMRMIASENEQASLFGGAMLGEVSVTLFFLVFNLLFLGVASKLAAMRHDPDESYEKRYKAYIRARRKVMDLKRQRDENHRFYLREAKDDQGVCRRLLVEYREVNMNQRDIKAVPRAWIDHPVQALIRIDEQQFALGEGTEIHIASEPEFSTSDPSPIPRQTAS